MPRVRGEPRLPERKPQLPKQSVAGSDPVSRSTSPFRFQRRTLAVAIWVVLPAVLHRSSEKVGPRPQKPGVIDPSEDVGYAIGAAQCTEMDHANGQPTLSVADLGGPIGLGRTAEVFARGDD